MICTDIGYNIMKYNMKDLKTVLKDKDKKKKKKRKDITNKEEE